jgi:integrase
MCWPRRKDRGSSISNTIFDKETEITCRLLRPQKRPLAPHHCGSLQTRQRVWFDLLAYTGLRRGDAVRLGRQHVRNGLATIKTEKTGVVVTLPILATLGKTLSAGPCGDLTFIAGKNGHPLTKESFGNLFRQACREAGLVNRSALSERSGHRAEFMSKRLKYPMVESRLVTSKNEARTSLGCPRTSAETLSH